MYFQVIHAEMPVHEPGLPDPQGLQLWASFPDTLATSNRYLTPFFSED